MHSSSYSSTLKPAALITLQLIHIPPPHHFRVHSSVTMRNIRSSSSLPLLQSPVVVPTIVLVIITHQLLLDTTTHANVVQSSTNDDQQPALILPPPDTQDEPFIPGEEESATGNNDESTPPPPPELELPVVVEECPFGIYGPQDSACICLSSGLWGIAEDYCSAPLALHAVKPNATFCILNNFNTQVRHLQKILSLDPSSAGPEVAQMSRTMDRIVDRFDALTTSVPLDEDVYYNHSILISHGGTSWKLTSSVGNVSFCLVARGHPTNEWCLFDKLTTTDPETGLSTFIPIRDLVHSPNCTHHHHRQSPEITSGDDDNDGPYRPLPVIFSSGCSPLKADSPCTTSAAAPTTTTKISFSDEDIYFFDDDTTSTKRPLLMSPLLLNPTELEELNSNSIVVKRNDDSSDQITTTTGNSGNEDLLEEDEDKISSAKQEIGHKLMRDQIDGYVDSVVAQLTGLTATNQPTHSSSSSKQTHPNKIPALKVLQVIKLIMQRTCSAVQADYFELALNSFLKVQFESFHAKEPFLSHSTYLRIAYALKLCYNNAKPHVFNTVTKSSAKCRQQQQQTTTTTDLLDVRGDGTKIVRLNATPIYASGLTESGRGTREPLIETVWKMLVNAHSYCYPYFKAYFNDHHALTVSLLPLFSNQIQDIWLKDGGYDNSIDDNDNKLYGGLLGDTVSIVRDVDNCVAASRFVSQYPWYMSRPLRDNNNIWRKRRRRDLTADDDSLAPQPIYLNNGQLLCLFDPDDPVAFLGKTVCE